MSLRSLLSLIQSLFWSKIVIVTVTQLPEEAVQLYIAKGTEMGSYMYCTHTESFTTVSVL